MDIKHTLAALGISHYSLVGDQIHVYQTVDWSGRGWRELPIKLHEVNGDFIVKGNDLIDFTNAPDVVTGLANFSYNDIKSMKGAPMAKILNMGTNSLISLEGSPKEVEIFSIDSNVHLTSIEHAPLATKLVFADNTSISARDREIYVEACRRGWWNPEKTLEENLEVMFMKNPDYIDEKNWCLEEKESLKHRLRGVITGKDYGV